MAQDPVRRLSVNKCLPIDAFLGLQIATLARFCEQGVSLPRLSIETEHERMAQQCNVGNATFTTHATDKDLEATSAMLRDR